MTRKFNYIRLGHISDVLDFGNNNNVTIVSVDVDNVAMCYYVFYYTNN